MLFFFSVALYIQMSIDPSLRHCKNNNIAIENWQLFSRQ